MNRTGIGGNQPPPLQDRLSIDYERLLADQKSLLALPELAPIFDDDDLRVWTQRAKDLKTAIDAIERARKAEKDQYLQDGRTVDDFFKRLAKPLADAAAAVIDGITAIQRKKLAAEQELQHKKAEEAKANTTPFDAPQRLHIAPVQKAAQVIDSATGKVAASITRRWTYKVTDPKKVPQQFLKWSINDVAIKAAIAAGAREIDGMDIFEDVKTLIRKT